MKIAFKDLNDGYYETEYASTLPSWTDDLIKTEVVIPLPPTPEQIQEQANNKARLYLSSTDWYVVRFAETGTPIPQDVLNARAEARLSIV